MSNSKISPAIRMSGQLTGIKHCPHCGVSSPVFLCAWRSNEHVPRADGQAPSRWGAYACTTCGHIVTAKGSATEVGGNPTIIAFYPPVWSPDTSLPDKVAHYLSQARNTLGSPDASVVMSASAVDAMLKSENLKDGSLYKRIEEAVTTGILTKRMSEWAHRVRLDANNPRHADDVTPHMSPSDARRAFDFAEALGDFLFVLPARMPPAAETI